MKTFIDIYFKIPEIIRFIVITIINSIVAYLFYIALFVGMMFRDYFYLAIAINFIIPVSLSFCTMRIFVFNTKGDLLIEYTKTIIVYVGAFLLNMLIIALLFRFLAIDIKAVQLISMLSVLIYSYLALKKYAFNSHVDFLGRK
jgi:putative flippase GtrA